MNMQSDAIFDDKMAENGQSAIDKLFNKSEVEKDDVSFISHYLQKENQPAQNIRLFLNSSKKKRSFQEYLLTTIFDDLKIGYTTSNIEEDEILGNTKIFEEHDFLDLCTNLLISPQEQLAGENRVIRAMISRIKEEIGESIATSFSQQVGCFNPFDRIVASFLHNNQYYEEKRRSFRGFYSNDKVSERILGTFKEVDIFFAFLDTEAALNISANYITLFHSLIRACILSLNHSPVCIKIMDWINTRSINLDAFMRLKKKFLSFKGLDNFGKICIKPSPPDNQDLLQQYEDNRSKRIFTTMAVVGVFGFIYLNFS